MIGRLVGWIAGLPRLVLIGLLRGYRLVVSPLYGQTCRFYPSCSQYALTAVERHGVIRGGRLAVWRLLRCNPWNLGGVDSVPPLEVLTHECFVDVADRPGESLAGAADTTSAPSPLRRVA